MDLIKTESLIVSAFFLVAGLVIHKGKQYEFFPSYRHLNKEMKEKTDFSSVGTFFGIGSYIIAAIAILIFIFSFFVNIQNMFFQLSLGALVILFVISLMIKMYKTIPIPKIEIVGVTFFLIALYACALYKFL